VVFAILLVSANTMAMTIRERTREVALLKTLGFRRRTVLMLLVAEAVILSMAGGLLGLLAAYGLFYKLLHSARSGSFAPAFKITPETFLVVLAVAAMVGFLSAVISAYRASGLNIVEGLRLIG
jgi:putative ABC transport system permease protein